MSYVQANTSNPLGRRALGRLRGLGWDNPPYPVYPISRNVARLNGMGDETNNGSITYRIDPRTGQYNFYRTDIKPRGVFLQNTFQHPAPPVMSALGTRVLPAGKSVSGSTIQRGRTSQGPMIAMRPGVQLSGLGCNDCGGRCNSLDGPRFARRRRFMGEADFPGACGPQSDGSIIPCGPDTAGATEQGDVSLPGVTPTHTAPPPGTTLETIINVPSSIAQGIQQIVQTATGPRVVTQPAPSWFNQSSSIGGAAIPNSFLALGGALFAALAMQGSKGRR